MKAPILTQSVWAYNSDGKRHRVSVDTLQEIDKAIYSAETYREDALQNWNDSQGIIEEMEYRQALTTVETLRAMRFYLTSKTDTI